MDDTHDDNLICIYVFLSIRKLEFLNQYEIKKLAVINIRDRDGVKNAINLMTIDGSRIFQCVSAVAKKEWMEKFDISIKFNQTKHRKGPAPQPPKELKHQKSSIDNKSITSDTTLSPTSSIMENYAPDWVIYAPEEIHAEMAQRHFEESLTLIQRVEDYIAKNKNSNVQSLNEIADKIKSMKQKLASVLLQELSNAQSRNLPVRGSRRPLKLLIEMGKAREACGILLRVCTTAIRTSQRQARRNNLAVSELFFCDVAQVASEFLRAFKSHTACTSALVVWCNVELQYFASQLVKHYLTKGTPLETVAKVVESVREPCAKLTKLGLDLTYHMEGLLRTAVQKLIEECSCRLLEPIGRAEDVWQPYNLQSKTNVRNTIKDFALLEIDLRPLVTGNVTYLINLSLFHFFFFAHFSR